MHDGMQYDPIRGQGHEPLKVGNSAIFKRYISPPLFLHGIVPNPNPWTDFNSLYVYGHTMCFRARVCLLGIA